jgi:hypothetical protein
MEPDPISAILGGVGIAMQIGGALGAAKSESKINQDQQQILGQEQAANDVRQQAVAMMAQRKRIQSVREAQMAASRSRAGAVGSGAQFGSGARQGEQMAQSGNAYNQETIDQDFLSANQMFGIDRSINSLKSNIGVEQTSMNNSQMWSTIGGDLLGGAKSLGNLGASAGGIGNALGNAIIPGNWGGSN